MHACIIVKEEVIEKKDQKTTEILKCQPRNLICKQEKNRNLNRSVFVLGNANPTVTFSFMI